MARAEAWRRAIPCETPPAPNSTTKAWEPGSASRCQLIAVPRSPLPRQLVRIPASEAYRAAASGVPRQARTAPHGWWYQTVTCGLDVLDEGHRGLRLGLRGRGAPRVVAAGRRDPAAPAEREVPVQVHPARVAALPRALAVGVELGITQSCTPSRSAARDLLEHLEPRALVAVDDADRQGDSRAVGVADTGGDDLPPANRAADHDALDAARPRGPGPSSLRFLASASRTSRSSRASASCRTSSPPAGGAVGGGGRTGGVVAGGGRGTSPRRRRGRRRQPAGRVTPRWSVPGAQAARPASSAGLSG